MIQGKTTPSIRFMVFYLAKYFQCSPLEIEKLPMDEFDEYIQFCQVQNKIEQQQIKKNKYGNKQNSRIRH